MISITCDICGNLAKYRIGNETILFMSDEHIEYGDHHICEECAIKLGINKKEKPVTENA